jgi:hypothetical protein
VNSSTDASSVRTMARTPTATPVATLIQPRGGSSMRTPRDRPISTRRAYPVPDVGSDHKCSLQLDGSPGFPDIVWEGGRGDATRDYLLRTIKTQTLQKEKVPHPAHLGHLRHL